MTSRVCGASDWLGTGPIGNPSHASITGMEEGLRGIAAGAWLKWAKGPWLRARFLARGAHECLRKRRPRRPPSPAEDGAVTTLSASFLLRGLVVGIWGAEERPRTKKKKKSGVRHRHGKERGRGVLRERDPRSTCSPNFLCLARYGWLRRARCGLSEE